MKTRTGKIAQLPQSIRDELCHRLENGKQAPELLEWLNSLPETKELLAQKFDNQPITKFNLTHWRHGGYLEWQSDQIREARVRRICETGGSLEKAETGDLFENFARITVAEMMVDLETIQKLRGEKRSERMHKLVRDLARLQNAYNRSRWAALAWTKHNGTENGTTVSPTRPEPQLETQNSALVTSSSPTPVKPGCTELKPVPPDEGEPKPNGNGTFILHFTNCNCDEPCPKCHAPDSDYPLPDAIRDRRYYKKHGKYPCDRHGNLRFLMNYSCDCACDRCAEKSNTAAVALPPAPIIYAAESPNENPKESSALLHPTMSPLSPLGPLNPNPVPQLTSFNRRLARLTG